MFQVRSIIPTCPICSFDKQDKQTVCHDALCKSGNTTKISQKVKKPKSTVEYIIANNCTKCIIQDEEVLKEVCDLGKCREQPTSVVAKEVKYPEQAVSDVIPQCGKILPTCPPMDDGTKETINQLGCSYKLPPAVVAGVVKYPVRQVEAVMSEYVSA